MLSVKDNPYDCKIVDWQLMAANHPLLDFALFIFTSVNPEDNEKWLAEFISNYCLNFERTCRELHIDCPFNFDGFRSMVSDKGFLMATLFLLITYNMLASRLQSIKLRFIWILNRAMKTNPQYF